MSDSLQTALRADLALLHLEDHLLHRARELYARGFAPPAVSPSQMAAVGEILRAAESLDDARAGVGNWLDAQMKKLEARSKRTGRAQSWLRPAEGPGPDTSTDVTLGEALRRTLSEEPWLGDEPPEELDRLAALRRFWHRFHGLYRYEDEAEEPMKLRDPDAPPHLSNHSGGPAP